MRWADEVHLGTLQAVDLGERLLEEWNLPSVIWRFQVSCDDLGYIAWPAIGPPIIHFRGYGTTLETLAHELAHHIEGPDVSTHGADHNFLTQLVAYQLLEYLRET